MNSVDCQETVPELNEYQCSFLNIGNKNIQSLKFTSYCRLNDGKQYLPFQTWCHW